MHSTCVSLVRVPKQLNVASLKHCILPAGNLAPNFPSVSIPGIAGASLCCLSFQTPIKHSSHSVLGFQNVTSLTSRLESPRTAVGGSLKSNLLTRPHSRLESPRTAV